MKKVIKYDKLPIVITIVEVSNKVEQKFNADLKAGLFSSEVRDLVEYWITEIEDLGYEEYTKSELFRMLRDHQLSGERQGQRSIVINQSGGRLIYKKLKKAIIVKVIKITASHDYT